jgi:RND superfamily putative drug exporter
MSATPPLLARTFRRLAVAIKDRSVSMSPKDAPSVQAVMRMGQVFKESDSDSAVMIVLESDLPLGDDAHKFQDRLVRQLKDDKAHVEHVQDFWGDPTTASGSQRADGKDAPTSS